MDFHSEQIKLMSIKHITVILGTRPEATKLAPVILELRRLPRHFRVEVIATGQHKELLLNALAIFGLVPDKNLNIMLPGQSLEHITAAALAKLEPVFLKSKTNLVLVEGDTTTVFAAALAAFYHHIPVAHLEAGLRTDDIYNPFPEEVNRRLVSVISTIHFAPTGEAKENLLKEGHASRSIYVTGNTAVDALLWAAAQPAPPLPAVIESAKKIILLTSHRRESWGKPIRRTFSTLKQIVRRFPEVEIIFPVHPNPQVKQAAREILNGVDRVHLLEPMDYLPFVHVMKKAHLILTDSGGIQEEAPSLNKPILVLRDKTERAEGLAAGTARLVGTDPGRILAEVGRLLTDQQAYQRMAQAQNPFGDGRASQRVRQALLHYFGLRPSRPRDFVPRRNKR
jgi:UDP-N-acetylglucosamine 2-epimerase (non-hydrolysing)